MKMFQHTYLGSTRRRKGTIVRLKTRIFDGPGPSHGGASKPRTFFPCTVTTPVSSRTDRAGQGNLKKSKLPNRYRCTGLAIHDMYVLPPRPKSGLHCGRASHLLPAKLDAPASSRIVGNMTRNNTLQTRHLQYGLYMDLGPCGKKRNELKRERKWAHVEKSTIVRPDAITRRHRP